MSPAARAAPRLARTSPAVRPLNAAVMRVVWYALEPARIAGQSKLTSRSSAIADPARS